MIGFDTPSKRIAEQNKSEQNKQNTMEMNMGMNMTNVVVKAEAIKRFSQLGQLITSEIYNNYTEEQKAHILQEFSFLSRVTVCL